ncbi:Rieske 2Fe-2S domain-containing protein [Streptomyces sp. NPDC099088]|uniref:aromatic ring-hydroxylating dioxygenase subunit alpha n=1 Tax=Streptomyces sp. NPDC099088 TaxID=3366101 RepID=UPI00380C85E5
MLVTAQPVLRRFWYPTMRIDELQAGPQPFTLLGEDIVLWLDADGRPAAAIDQCAHRFARLSRGGTTSGNVQCPYHGWQYDRDGHCVAVPQAPDHTIPRSYRVKAFHCEERYGYAWVCLGDPLEPIPHIAEAEDLAFRAMHMEREVFQCSSLAGIDNFFDNSHHHFVHGSTFGDPNDASPMVIDSLEETPSGIVFRFTIRNYGQTFRDQAESLSKQEPTLLVRELTWFLPFTVRVRIRFPSGAHSISLVTYTPLSDTTCQFVCVLLRDDTEDDVPAASAVAEIAAIVREDKAILECVDPDVPLNLAAQQHMAGDRAGMLMRRKLQDLLDQHGEEEVTRHQHREVR